MSIKAVPQVGDRTVVLSTISDWIESKIQLLLEKVLVVPNMVGLQTSYPAALKRYYSLAG